MRRRTVLWLMVGVAVTATVVFVALTVIVVSSSPLAFDSRAFQIANDLRARWLDRGARVVTTLGLLAIVGPVVLVGAAVLHRRGHGARAAALLLGAGLAWISVWITKLAVARARPPAPLVHTTGHSYPSAHAANSVGWLALAIAVTVLIPTRSVRAAAVATGALLAALVGLSRVYLRAHYATDVLAGEALAVAGYALAAIVALACNSRRRLTRKTTASAPARQV